MKQKLNTFALLQTFSLIHKVGLIFNCTLHLRFKIQDSRFVYSLIIQEQVQYHMQAMKIINTDLLF